MIECMKCKKQFPDDSQDGKGIHIENYSIDIFPEYLFICDDCATNLAVNFLTGKIPGLSLITKAIGKMKG